MLNDDDGDDDDEKKVGWVRNTVESGDLIHSPNYRVSNKRLSKYLEDDDEMTWKLWTEFHRIHLTHEMQFNN